jgi:uncharacterized protein (DUF1697 family)
MKYVALLRGINVGGKNIVSMQQLKAAVEQVGMENVSTYINSGNVLFENDKHTAQELKGVIEKAIESTFNIPVIVMIRSQKDIKAIAKALPANWTNDNTMKCDIIFLGDSIDSPGIMEKIRTREGIDTVKYAPGALLWAVDRENITRSYLTKLVGTPIYKQMTVRNSNTLRKLAALLE